MLSLEVMIYIELTIWPRSSNEHYRKAYLQIYASLNCSNCLSLRSLCGYTSIIIMRFSQRRRLLRRLWNDAMDPHFATQKGGNFEPMRAKGTYNTFQKVWNWYPKCRSPGDIKTATGTTMSTVPRSREPAGDRTTLEHCHQQCSIYLRLNSLDSNNNWAGYTLER